MSVFVHAQGIETVHAEGCVKKWQNSVHVVVECSLISCYLLIGHGLHKVHCMDVVAIRLYL